MDWPHFFDIPYIGVGLAVQFGALKWKCVPNVSLPDGLDRRGPSPRDARILRSAVDEVDMGVWSRTSVGRRRERPPRPHFASQIDINSADAAVQSDKRRP